MNLEQRRSKMMLMYIKHHLHQWETLQSMQK